MSVPVLRFDEFGDDWAEKRLIDVSSRIGDGLHSTPVYEETGEFYFVNGNNLTNNKIEIKEGTKRLSLGEYLKHKIELTRNSILMSINGTIGNLAFFNDEKVILGKSACYINLKSQENKYFVFNLLQTIKIKSHFEQELTGSTIKNLSLTTIKNTKGYFPSKEEQTKIANFLTSVDEKIQHLTQKADLLAQYKKGVMQQIFSQELRLKDDDESEFPAWQEKQISELSIYISDGNYGEQYPKADELKQNGVPFIRANNISDLKLSWNDMKFIDAELHSVLTSGHLEAQDILVTTRGDIGMVAFVESEFHGANINAQICLLRVVDKTRLNAKYLLQLLSSSNCQKQFKELQTGSALKQLPKKNLGQILIPHPNIFEQTKIANFLTAIDDKITHTQTQLAAVKQYKQGLLQQMFV